MAKMFSPVRSVLINGEDVSQFVTDFRYVSETQNHWHDDGSVETYAGNPRYEFQFVIPAGLTDGNWNRVKIATPGGKWLNELRKAVGEWMVAVSDRDEALFREDWELLRACQDFLEEGGRLD